MCRPNDLQPGAVVVDQTTKRMYEVSQTAARVTKLIDVASPIDDPKVDEFLTVNAVKRLELVRPGTEPRGHRQRVRVRSVGLMFRRPRLRRFLCWLGIEPPVLDEARLLAWLDEATG